MVPDLPRVYNNLKVQTVFLIVQFDQDFYVLETFIR